MFGFARLTSVTKGNISSCTFGFFFNAALLLSNLSSARVFRFGFLCILFLEAFFKVFNLRSEFSFV